MTRDYNDIVSTRAYRVTTEGDVEGRSILTLGYATGKESDILKYYDDRKAYDIRLEEIKIVAITSYMADHKVDLLKRKTELEKELESIKNKLG